MPDKLTDHIADAELVLELKMGTQRSFEVLFDKYSPVILSILEILEIEEHRSEQVLINCFIRMKKEINGLDLNKTRLYTWVLEIARETINELCLKEIEQFKIQTQHKYVNNHSTSKTPLLDLVMTQTSSYEKLAMLIGVTKEELMMMVKTEVNQMKK